MKFLFTLFFLIGIGIGAKSNAELYTYANQTVVAGVITIPSGSTAAQVLSTVNMASLTGSTSIGLIGLAIFPVNETQKYEGGIQFRNTNLTASFIDAGLPIGFLPGAIYRMQGLFGNPNSYIPGDIRIWVRALAPEPSPVAMPFIAILGY